MGVFEGSRTAWNSRPQDVKVAYAKLTSTSSLYLSTMGYAKARGNLGRPRSKAKYKTKPIVNEYREGKVKSTPEGE